MMVFIITIILMLVVVTFMAGYGYAKYSEWTTRPEIHVEKSLFQFHDEVYEDKVNITAHVTLNNRGDKDTGLLELEWMIMPAADASDNVFILRGEKEVDPMDIGETRDIILDFSLPMGDYRIAYRTYEDGYFGYEGRQSLSVGEDDTQAREGAEDERWTEESTPFLSLLISILTMLITTIIWRKRR